VSSESSHPELGGTLVTCSPGVLVGSETTGSRESGVLAAQLAVLRFTASSEDALQRGIEEWLSANYPGLFEREARLSAANRPDFFSPTTGVLIEVKWSPTGGSLTKVVSQLARYAEDPRVREILFCSPSRRVVSQVPDVLCEVPVVGVVLHTGL